eukprot:CAMPEP_0197191520 /NCGR_PEP_ID=MMETSP1423-20130617/23550_1 /TAXON_ID=476441 /ORGANISM="Pseudo-nitzschia heimii, Strain UNC1101" /LENGTH=99 /DNA_ID=CAMNT_0042644181 /DNA_START=44 /DNA_END=340 /DNA_ORIENTATION=-
MRYSCSFDADAGANDDGDFAIGFDGPSSPSIFERLNYRKRRRRSTMVAPHVDIRKRSKDDGESKAFSHSHQGSEQTTGRRIIRTKTTAWTSPHSKAEAA